MKAVAVSAEYFDNCQSSSPRQGPGANSFSLLTREIQSVLFYTSIFNIINFQVFVNTDIMKETGNGVHEEDRNRKDYDGDRNRRVHDGYRNRSVHDGYPNGWTDHETGSELRRGISLSGCGGAALSCCRNTALSGLPRGSSLRLPQDCFLGPPAGLLSQAAAGFPQITLWNLLWTPRRDNRSSPCEVPCICGIPPLRRRCIFSRHRGGICLARQPVTDWA